MTGEELLIAALRKSGVVASGETPTDAEIADALAEFNDLLDSWSAEGLSVYQVARQVFSLASGQQTRTIGPGGNFNVARPPRIVRAGIVDANGEERELRIVSESGWGEVARKAESGRPEVMWPDGGAPLLTLSFWPVPPAGYSVALYTWTALTELEEADLEDDLELPPGYRRALRYNLAVALAAEYGAEVAPSTAAIAQESLGILRSANVQPAEMRIDFSLLPMPLIPSIYSGDI